MNFKKLAQEAHEIQQRRNLELTLENCLILLESKNVEDAKKLIKETLKLQRK